VASSWFFYSSGKLFVAFINRRGLVVGLSTLQSGDFGFKYRTRNSSILTERFSGYTQSLQLNLLTPNVNYSGRTAPLTSKVTFYIFIQQIQLLNILNMVYTLRFFLFKMQFVS